MTQQSAPSSLAPMPDWLRDRLRCPCPRHEALGWAQGPRCTGGACTNAAGFPIVAGQPVLIDFPNGILDRERFEQAAGQSPVRRAGRGLRYWIRRLAYGQNAVAPRNAKRLIELLAGIEAPVILIVGGGEPGVGCDRLRAAPGIRLIAFDIYASPETRFVADAHGIPLATGSVDAVWIQAVLEHVLEPSRIVDEIHRVLRPGGIVYAETPFMQQVHEGAFDFTRFTESGHRWLFRRFELIDSGAVSGPGTVLIWSIRAAMTGLTRSRKIGELLTLPFFWLRWIDRFTPPGHTSDGAGGVFFLGRRAETGLAPRNMVGAYRGAQKN